jgi:hypothetical protein
MIMRSLTRRFPFVSRLLLPTAVFACITASAPAQTLSLLEGTWNHFTFSVPSQLSLPGPGNKVTHIPERDVFSIESGQIVVQANGTFTGDPSGSFTVGKQGQVIARIGGEPDLTLLVNAAHDFLVTANVDGQFQDLTLAVRAPATLTTADLAGDWNIVAFDTPKELIQTIGTNGYVSDVQPLDHFELFTGTATLTAGGTVSGTLDGAFSGTFSVGANGQVTANVDDEIATLFVNAGKDVMVRVFEEPDSNYQEVQLFTRVPASVTLAELQGVWKLAYFDTPNQLTLSKDGQGDVTNIFEKDHFVSARQSLTLGHNGFFTGQFDTPSVGTISLGAQGAVTATVTNNDGEEETVHLKLSANKEVMTGVLSDSFAQEIIVLTKAPLVSGPQDFGLLIHRGKVYWAPGAARKLQRSTDLVNWPDVPDSTGTHTYEPSGSPAIEVLRLAEPEFE